MTRRIARMPDNELTSNPDHSVAANHGWPEVDCALVEDGRRGVPLFPLELLPLPWRSWVSETARSAGAPVDYVAQSLLGVVAGLCGAGALVRVTPGWSEPLVLWHRPVHRAFRVYTAAPPSIPAMGRTRRPAPR